MNSLLIRADGGREIGTGHLMRCLALAQAWQDAGGAVQFVTPPGLQGIHSRLISEGMDVTCLEAPAGSTEDAQTTASLAMDSGAEWAVVDGYAFGEAYQVTLREAGLRVLMLDDYGHAG